MMEGRHFQTGQHISLDFGGGLISKVEIGPNATGSTLPIIAPGLVDLQINGCFGMDFNESSICVDTVSRMTRQLFQEGVTSYLPTVITNGDVEIEHELRQIAKCREQDTLAAQCIPAIHLEGPFISPEDGPRGAHSRSFVKAPDWELFQGWQESAQGAIRIVTLSPEWPNALDFIAKCVQSGVIVSIGHTAASPEQIREAVAAGATMSTHLGNGSHTMLPRHQNYVWEQLAEDALWAGFIADGFHLPKAFLKTAMRAKRDRAVLVSDAVALSGMPPGEYDSNVGKRVVLTPEGKLHLANNCDILAGSAQLLPWGISHLARNHIVTLAEAWVLASLRPANIIDLPVQRGLAVGAPADVVAFAWDGWTVDILQTVKHGRVVYEN